MASNERGNWPIGRRQPGAARQQPPSFEMFQRSQCPKHAAAAAFSAVLGLLLRPRVRKSLAHGKLFTGTGTRDRLCFWQSRCPNSQVPIAAIKHAIPRPDHSIFSKIIFGGPSRWWVGPLRPQGRAAHDPFHLQIGPAAPLPVPELERVASPVNSNVSVVWASGTRHDRTLRGLAEKPPDRPFLYSNY